MHKLAEGKLPDQAEIKQMIQQLLHPQDPPPTGVTYPELRPDPIIPAPPPPPSPVPPVPISPAAPFPSPPAPGVVTEDVQLEVFEVPKNILARKDVPSNFWEDFKANFGPKISNIVEHVSVELRNAT